MNRRLFIFSVLVLTLLWRIDADAAISIGAYLPGTDNYAGDIASFNQGTGRTHAIIMFYRNISAIQPDNLFFLQQCMMEGAVPYVNCTGLFPYQSIINGSEDAYFHIMARAFYGFGGRVLMTLDAEMNLAPDSPTSFIMMWQRVHDIFKSEGATKVEWVWSPAYGSPAGQPDYNLFYPGDSYVDWVGTEGFCWNDSNSAAFLFTPILNVFAQRYPKKPAMISYMGAYKSAATDKAEWILNAYATLPSYNNLKAALWWNDISGSFDFRIFQTSYPPGAVPALVTGAYGSAIASTNYISTLPPLSELTPGGGSSTYSLSLSTLPSLIGRGENFTINYIIKGLNQAVDGYLAVVLPNGGMLVADRYLNWTRNVTPIARSFNPGGSASGSLLFKVPSNVSPGVYTFESVLVPAGFPVTDSRNWLGGSLSTTTLTVR